MYAETNAYALTQYLMNNIDKSFSNIFTIDSVEVDGTVNFKATIFKDGTQYGQKHFMKCLIDDEREWDAVALDKLKDAVVRQIVKFVTRELCGLETFHSLYKKFGSPS